jgi:sarcosine oxidase subunit delta
LLKEMRMALLISCPICGRRNGYEFRFGGEDKGPRPAEKDLTVEAWCEYAQMNKCIAGVQKEWWYHRDGCGSWFTIYRDTRCNLEVPRPDNTDESERTE